MLRHAILVLVVLAGCGSDDPLDLASRDPRCVAACPETMPQTDGVGDVCSTTSRAACLDDCQARIKGVATVCASCLLENAQFSPGDENSVGTCGGGGGGGGGNPPTCMISGWNGTCTFNQGDSTMQLACEKQVSPRREVDCTAMFRPTSECSSSCN